MKTTEEILAKINADQNGDSLGFATDVLLHYLDHSDAKPFLNEEWVNNPSLKGGA